jgi:hypothetical protein
MASEIHGGPVSRAAFFTGWVLTVLLSLLLLSGVAFALAQPQKAAEGMVQTGYPRHAMTPIVIAELVCVILYLLPRTAALGAVLLTGYLGGAVATHVRIDEWQFVIAVAVGVEVWLSLYLRDRRVRALLPMRR